MNGKWWALDRLQFPVAIACVLLGGVMCAAQKQSVSAPPVKSGADLTAAQRAEARAIFKQLIETNTTESNTKNPKATGNVTTAAEAMRKRLIDAGFPAADVVVVGPASAPAKWNMVARYRGRENGGRPDSKLKPVLMIGHLDVVEAMRADWTTDPFTLVEKDGYFYGRGTQDMKDEDAAMVEAMLILHREGYVPDRDIILALTGDEETGNDDGVEWLVKNHRELVEAAFVMNPDSGGVNSAKGVPVQMAVGASEKLYADFKLTATSAGGHSSRPSPDNAIYHVADALGRIERYKFPVELNAVTRAYFAKMAMLVGGEQAAAMNGLIQKPMQKDAVKVLEKDNWYNAVMRTTCVATMMQAGHARNALPQLATANVNCRILPGHTPAEVRAQLVRVMKDPKVTIELLDSAGNVSDAHANAKAMTPPALNKMLFDALDTVTQEMWPGLPILPEMGAGASDSKYTAAAGIPSYGVGGMMIDNDDDRAHGKDERLRVGSFYTGVEFYRLLLMQVTK